MAELVYPPVVLLARTAFRALDLRTTVQGAHHVPRTGGAVLAANHFGYLEFVFVGLAARPSGRRVRFMAKEEAFTSRVTGPLMRGMHHIPVDRAAGAASYGAALRALKAGEVVGVFPEATVSRAYALKPFKSGATRMAQHARVPLLPCVVWGAHRLMTKGRPRDLRRGRTVAVAVGEPLHPTRGDDADAVTAELQARMSRMLEELMDAHPDRPAPGEDAWWLPASRGGTAPTLEEAARLDAAELAERQRRARG